MLTRANLHPSPQSKNVGRNREKTPKTVTRFDARRGGKTAEKIRRVSSYFGAMPVRALTAVDTHGQDETRTQGRNNSRKIENLRRLHIFSLPPVASKRRLLLAQPAVLDSREPKCPKGCSSCVSPRG